jgi:molybdate transport system substrate-binding protein
VTGLVLALAAFGLAGCSDAAPEAGGAANKPGPVLVVAAASDLQTALPELIAAFRNEVPGIGVNPTFGASGQLAEQIKAGAPFDLFLAANVAFVDDLAAAGAVERESVRPYAVGSLVLAVNKEAGGAVAGMADLASENVRRVAIANPETAPYGAAARQALTRAGLWETLRPKVVNAGSVRQALQFVQTGNAEAGFVGKATADVPEVRVVEVDPTLYDPIVQGLGVVSGSPRKAEAGRFVAFVLGPKGQAVLASFGFRPPPPAPRPTAAAP